RPPEDGELSIGEAVLFRFEQKRRVGRFDVWTGADFVLDGDNLADAIEKPAVDLGALENVVHREAGLEGVTDKPDALMVRRRQAGADLVESRRVGRAPAVGAVATEAETARFQAAQRFLQRFLERPSNGHR